MDEETIIKAKLIAAVLCRVVDYHAAASSAPRPGLAGVIADAEAAVAVAIENVIEAGLE